jgi:hypothetical protein
VRIASRPRIFQVVTGINSVWRFCHAAAGLSTGGGAGTVAQPAASIASPKNPVIHLMV